MAKKVSKKSVSEDAGLLGTPAPAPAPPSAKGKSSQASAKSAGRSRAAEVRDIAPPASQPLHPPPGRLADLIGHEGPRRVIEAALRSGRVHHAWVFHGPEGVGKFTAALAFAALLLDPTTAENMGGEFDRDPESRVARLLAAGTHPDLHVVVKELALFHEDPNVRSRLLRSIPIDVLRQFLLEPGYLGSTLRVGGRAAKVFVVDEAELLNNQGQNALLKFLEEPPEAR